MVADWQAAADDLIATAPRYANWEYHDDWDAWSDRSAAVQDALPDFDAREAFSAYVWSAIGDVPFDPARPDVW